MPKGPALAEGGLTCKAQLAFEKAALSKHDVLPEPVIVVVTREL